MFQHRCVCSVFSKSIKMCNWNMKWTTRKSEPITLTWPVCSLAVFSNDVTFQLFKDLKRCRGKLTAVFSILHLSGKVRRFYIFLYFHCNISHYIPLCWQLWWLRYYRLALYEVKYCYDLVCCAFRGKKKKKREKSFHAIVVHASPSHWWPFFTKSVKSRAISNIFQSELFIRCHFFNGICLKCVKTCWLIFF